MMMAKMMMRMTVMMMMMMMMMMMVMMVMTMMSHIYQVLPIPYFSYFVHHKLGLTFAELFPSSSSLQAFKRGVRVFSDLHIEVNIIIIFLSHQIICLNRK